MSHRHITAPLIVDALQYLGVTNDKELTAIPIEDLRRRLRMNFPSYVRGTVYRLHGWCSRGTTMTVEHIGPVNKNALQMEDTTMIMGIRADRLEDMIEQAVLRALRIHNMRETPKKP